MTTIANGAALKAARKSLGLSVADLADRLRLLQPNGTDFIREIERGKRDLTGPIAVAIELLIDRRELLADLEKFAKHDGLCARIGGYGYCNCGLEAALERTI